MFGRKRNDPNRDGSLELPKFIDVTNLEGWEFVEGVDAWGKTALVDLQGRTFAIRRVTVDEDGATQTFVNFSDMVHSTLAGQTQYISRYVNPSFRGERPQLGVGLRIDGDPSDYHSFGIDSRDVAEFLKRYRAERAYSTQSITDENGQRQPLTKGQLAELERYLTSIGAFAESK